MEKENKNSFDYTSYPEGYEKLVKKMIPFYLRPAKNMLMRLFLQILTDD
jgi:hypothetical protein